LGAQNQPSLKPNQWQVQISYQYSYSNEFYVGDQRNDAAAPFGEPPRRRVNQFNLDVAYGLSNRVNLDLTVPFSSNRGGNQEGTPGGSHKFYEYHTSGLGDISLESEYWLSDPTKPSRVTGSVGLGVLAPTGSDSESGKFFSPSGDVNAPIDETIQLGNGGWALLLRAQGTAQLGGPFYAYGSGYYGMSLNARTDVMQGGAYRGVPDTYSARLGAAYVLPVPKGFVLSVGGRINGVTVRDVIGGGDLFWRRPGYEVYVEPGLTWASGANMASVSVPIRAYQKKLDSLLDESLNRHVGSDFVSYLILASYAHRF
jgi:hypothetical protein